MAIMGIIDNAKERVVETVFSVEPIRQAREAAVREAVDDYYNRVKTEWDSQLSKIQEANETAVSRAFEAGFYEGRDGNDDPGTSTFRPGGMGYKRISDRYVREGAIDYKKAMQTAWELWQKSPIARRLLTLRRDHIIGHNAMPSAENTKAAEVIKGFWMDNKLDKRASEFTLQLSLFGEQCYPAFVRQSDGRTMLGYIDPMNITAVKKHPENSLEDWAIVVSRYDKSGMEVGKDIYRIIREDENYVDDNQSIQSRYEGRLVTAEQAVIQPWELEMIRDVKGLNEGETVQYDGSCFFYKVNAVSNQGRGMSYLLPLADWIDQGDEVLFALADKERIANYFVWFIKLIGASPENVNKRRKEIAAEIPKPGGAYVHNDSEEPSLNSPDLNQAGTIETFRTILGLILGGDGFPVHWFGYGDDANRATAVAQSDPTAKSLEHDQGTIKNMLMTMCRFAIDQKIIAGAGDGLESEEYELNLDLPEVSTKDMSRVSSALSQTFQSLETAEAQGWLSKETSVQIVAKMLAEYDIDIDVKEEMRKAATEKEEREKQEEQNRNDALRQMMNGQNGDGDFVGTSGRPGNGRIMMDDTDKIAKR